MFDFDAIVIGSGFGGAITSCRLAEAGYKVLVLERGRRWNPTNFPRKPDDPWVFDPVNPAARNGWFDFRIFPHMTSVQGAGVGGGSLVYANISIPAKKETFDAGWPAEITYDELTPHYKTVGEVLNVQRVPETQWPERTKLMKDAATNAGVPDKFEPLELAVSFDKDWNYELSNPHAVARSKTFTNAQGQQQGTCVHLGNCDIGCDVNARNTLDLNYLALAEKKGAEIRPLHLVRNIAPQDNGYKVSFDRIDGKALKPGTATARLVIVAAGSMGSTELLLRCREQQTLTSISNRLGVGWSSNGDFLTPAIHPLRKVDPTHGPTITSAINLLDHGADGQDVFIEDGGFPDIIEGLLRRAATNPPSDPFAKLIVESLRPLLAGNLLTDHVMPWFAQARDAADGRLSLKNGALHLDWDIKASRKTMDAVVHTHQRLAQLTQGMALTPLTWTVGHNLITPHALGGCNMGSTAADGVVDHKGEVFGYKNLFVADGAIVPKAIGLNPSRTIGALAERIAAAIVAEGR
jgi:cholesterol oxidase